MVMNNEEMVANIELLSALTETGRLGYAIARNIRKLTDAAKEYLDMRQKVFEEFGDVMTNGKVQIPVAVLKEKLGDIGEIEHDVDIYQVDEEVFISGKLNSAQMARLIWMVKEEEGK